MRPGDVLVITSFAVREAIHRRALLLVAIVTAALLVVFGIAADVGLDSARERTTTDLQAELVGATLLGTAAFTTLLLGGILGVFLTHTTIRGDAEQGLLQPLLVRPVGRSAVLFGRLLAGAGLAAAYTLLVWLAAVALMHFLGEWTPDRWLAPGLYVAGAAAIVAVLSTAASTVLTGTAGGIATIMVLGVGFTIGLMAQVAETVDAAGLVRAADALSWALPFEALYREALGIVEAEVRVSTQYLMIGPFGGAHDAGRLLVPWAVTWAIVVTVLACLRADRLDT
jgi:ABC-type transport system involved in multi-copper enzyme maturation permease subunit